MGRTIVRVAVLGCCCLLAGAAGRDERAQPVDPTAADLQAMQGIWQREYRTPQGIIRVEKTVSGERDLVTEYDADGKVIHAHAAKFTLKESSGVRVFTFSEYVATAGAGAGQPWVGPTSYLYRIDGDLMYEAWGLIDGDRSAPSVASWKRLKKP
jgi:hypothetical protein